MNRRGFLVGMLAACAAPAVVKAASLMPVRSRIILPRIERVDVLYGWSATESGIAIRTMNQYVRIEEITREALAVLSNTCDPFPNWKHWDREYKEPTLRARMA